MIRPDLLFSYWIISWYVLYEINVIKYNPKFWLIIALLSNFYNLYLHNHLLQYMRP